MTEGVVGRLLAVERVPTRTRFLLAVLCGCIAGAVTVQKNQLLPFPRDFGQVWFAARMILRGVNPYPLVGPGLAYDWPWPLLYPIPAAIVAIPFTPLPLAWSSVAFMVVGGSAFAWALMEHGYGPLFGFLGGGLHYAAEVGQWSPLFAASLVVPWIGFFFLAKPTIGFAMFVARPSWWPIVGGILLAAVAFVIQPTWVSDWLRAVHTNNQNWLPYTPYISPVLSPGGFLALLSLLRWRRPEARLIAALACVPQTPVLYETVPLFLVPRTFWQAAALVACSYAQHHVAQWLTPAQSALGENSVLAGTLLVLFLYAPCVLMVLRRSNEGEVPAWLETRIMACAPRFRRGGAELGSDRAAKSTGRSPSD